ncbi:hypothetical protein [Nocardioides sp. B-3]|uniref:hypothetical protein n=1 Tax=Nocardioides sp. B-3 TaxID=2895565 RepID=UPI0021520C97|nr:hypothetical protein [Nocardioides sp. B-3]UUZ60654.1 hypothetical protein LP418_07455 [Nocardioides sp. B-3]
MLAAVLVAVTPAAVATAAVLLVTRDAGSGDTRAGREDVMAQTEQFMLRMGSYGPDLLDDSGAMPDYRSKVKEVITPKFAASFDRRRRAPPSSWSRRPASHACRTSSPPASPASTPTRPARSSQVRSPTPTR